MRGTSQQYKIMKGYFTAKRIDNGEWVTGFFTQKKIGSLIVPVIEVYKEWDTGDNYTIIVAMDYYEIDVDTLEYIIDWKLIEKEIKHLIDNYGVPENNYRGYPNADDIVRTVKYIIEHKQSENKRRYFQPNE